MGLRVGLAAVFLWPIMLRQGHYPAFRQHWRPIMLAGVIIRQLLGEIESA